MIRPSLFRVLLLTLAYALTAATAASAQAVEYSCKSVSASEIVRALKEISAAAAMDWTSSSESSTAFSSSARRLLTYAARRTLRETQSEGKVAVGSPSRTVLCTSLAASRSFSIAARVLSPRPNANSS
jgi:long-subunit fatty acid transport protein